MLAVLLGCGFSSIDAYLGLRRGCLPANRLGDCVPSSSWQRVIDSFTTSSIWPEVESTMTPSDRLWRVLPLSWNRTNPDVRSRSYQASSESYPSARAPLSAMALSRAFRLSSGNWSHDQWLSRGSPAKLSGGLEFHIRLNRWPWRLSKSSRKLRQKAPSTGIARSVNLPRKGLPLGRAISRHPIEAVG